MGKEKKGIGREFSEENSPLKGDLGGEREEEKKIFCFSLGQTKGMERKPKGGGVKKTAITLIKNRGLQGKGIKGTHDHELS